METNVVKSQISMAEIPAILQMLAFVTLKDNISNPIYLIIFAIVVLLSMWGHLVAYKRGGIEKEPFAVGTTLLLLILVVSVCSALWTDVNKNIWLWCAYMVLSFGYVYDLCSSAKLSKLTTHYIIVYALAFLTML